MITNLREPAFHALGTPLPEKCSTDEMIKLAGLNDWNVRLVDVAERFPEFSFNSLPSLVVRDNPFNPGQVDVLGQVGERYTVYQNEELFHFADNILDGAGSWESAGDFRNGAVVFGTLVIDQAQVIIDNDGVRDEVTVFLLASTSHNGTSTIVFALTPVRIRCMNTLNFALKTAKQSFKIKHTAAVKAKVDDARNTLGLTFAYVDAFSAEANALFQRSITTQDFHDLIGAVYPEPPEDTPKGGHKKWETKRDALVDIYFGPTNEGITGTAWGAVNALTERIDWYRTARKGNTENLAIAASGFDLVTTREKQRILTTTKELFKVQVPKVKTKKLITV